MSTGSIRVNGGFLSAVNMQSGSLLFVAITDVPELDRFVAGSNNYAIAGGAWSNDHVVAEGEAVPNSGAEMLYELLSKRATPIALNIEGDTMHVVLENNVEGWLVNTTMDATSSENPGIAPEDGTGVATLPSLQAAIRALGQVSVPDVETGSGMKVINFGSAVVSRGDKLFLDTNFLVQE